MSDPFIGELRTMAFGFPPKGWAVCNGQMLPIAANQALFSLLGTTFGGDGRTTFGLPDLRGRAGVSVGAGPGLPVVVAGEVSGSESVTLQIGQVPAHTHTLNAVGDLATTGQPAGALPAAKGRGGLAMFGAPGSNNTTLAPGAVSGNVGGLPHDNMQPSLVVNVCIALQGIFPSRP